MQRVSSCEKVQFLILAGLFVSEHKQIALSGRQQLICVNVSPIFATGCLEMRIKWVF